MGGKQLTLQTLMKKKELKKSLTNSNETENEFQDDSSPKKTTKQNKQSAKKTKSVTLTEKRSVSSIGRQSESLIEKTSVSSIDKQDRFLTDKTRSVPSKQNQVDSLIEKQDDYLTDKTRGNSSKENQVDSTSSFLNKLKLDLLNAIQKQNEIHNSKIDELKDTINDVNRKVEQSIEDNNQNLNQMKSELLKAMDEKIESSNSNDDDKEGLVDLYPGSNLKVDKTHHQIVLKTSDSFTSYVQKIFTSLVSVEDTYGCNLNGGPSKIDKTMSKRRPFSRHILNEIYNSVNHHFEEELNVLKSNFFKLRKKKRNENDFNKSVCSLINNSVSKKLSQINRHFNCLINGTEVKSELSRVELALFKNYEYYVENLDELNLILNDEKDASEIQEYSDNTEIDENEELDTDEDDDDDDEYKNAKRSKTV